MGYCCDHGVVDDCGVCGGDNGCDFLAEINLLVRTNVGVNDSIFDITSQANNQFVNAFRQFLASNVYGQTATTSMFEIRTFTPVVTSGAPVCLPADDAEHRLYLPSLLLVLVHPVAVSGCCPRSLLDWLVGHIG